MSDREQKETFLFVFLIQLTQLSVIGVSQATASKHNKSKLRAKEKKKIQVIRSETK